MYKYVKVNDDFKEIETNKQVSYSVLMANT